MCNVPRQWLNVSAAPGGSDRRQRRTGLGTLSAPVCSGMCPLGTRCSVPCRLAPCTCRLRSLDGVKMWWWDGQSSGLVSGGAVNAAQHTFAGRLSCQGLTIAGWAGFTRRFPWCVLMEAGRAVRAVRCTLVGERPHRAWLNGGDARAAIAGVSAGRYMRPGTARHAVAHRECSVLWELQGAGRGGQPLARVPRYDIRCAVPGGAAQHQPGTHSGGLALPVAVVPAVADGARR